MYICYFIVIIFITHLVDIICIQLLIKHMHYINNILFILSILKYILIDKTINIYIIMHCT